MSHPTTDDWREWAKNNCAEWDEIGDIEGELGRTPLCPTCHKNDQVEDSIEPEKFDGYCYRCKAPFSRSVRR